MKLPRYLQVMLIATVGAVIWSQFSEDEPTPDAPHVTQPAPPPAVKFKSANRPTRVNLFPKPKADANAPVKQTESKKTIKHEPSTPALPFQALGVWWSHHQRVILLTNGVETWPVCRRCKAEGKIWVGNEPAKGWQLKAVEKDHLLFEWRFNHIQRRLELGDLQSEPTR